LVPLAVSSVLELAICAYLLIAKPLESKVRFCQEYLNSLTRFTLLILQYLMISFYDNRTIYPLPTKEDFLKERMEFHIKPIEWAIIILGFILLLANTILAIYWAVEAFELNWTKINFDIVTRYIQKVQRKLLQSLKRVIKKTGKIERDNSLQETSFKSDTVLLKKDTNNESTAEQNSSLMTNKVEKGVPDLKRRKRKQIVQRKPKSTLGKNSSKVDNK